MLFTPDYPTLTPMTLCDQNRGGWYIAYGGAQISESQQATCFKSAPSKVDNRDTFDKIKKSIPEPPEYVPMPPMPATGGGGGEGTGGGGIPQTCDVGKCCTILKSYKEKNWAYNSSTLGECAGCPSATNPDLPSICLTHSSRGPEPVIPNMGQGGSVGIGRDAIELPRDMWNMGDELQALLPTLRSDDCRLRAVFGDNKSTVNQQQAEHLCPIECKRDNNREWRGRWTAKHEVKPGIFMSSCECCTRASKEGCVDVPGLSAGPNLAHTMMCDSTCSTVGNKTGAATDWVFYEWNKEYTNDPPTCRCCLKK